MLGEVCEHLDMMPIRALAAGFIAPVFSLSQHSFALRTHVASTPTVPEVSPGLTVTPTPTDQELSLLNHLETTKGQR